MNDHRTCATSPEYGSCKGATSKAWRTRTATIPVGNWSFTNDDATIDLTIGGSIDDCLTTAQTLASAMEVNVRFLFNDRRVTVCATSDLDLLRSQFSAGCVFIGP